MNFYLLINKNTKYMYKFFQKTKESLTDSVSAFLYNKMLESLKAKQKAQKQYEEDRKRYEDFVFVSGEGDEPLLSQLEAEQEQKERERRQREEQERRQREEQKRGGSGKQMSEVETKLVESMLGIKRLHLKYFESDLPSSFFTNEEAFKKTFKKMSLKIHPDKNEIVGKEKAEEDFKELLNYYQTIKDIQKWSFGKPKKQLGKKSKKSLKKSTKKSVKPKKKYTVKKSAKKSVKPKKNKKSTKH